MKRSHAAVPKPEADHPSLAEIRHDNVGSNTKFGRARRFHEHEDRVGPQCSQLEGEGTTWEEESSFYGVIDGCFVGSNHDHKDWFPQNLTDIDRQDLEKQFQGDSEETYRQVDTTGKLTHCQSSHVPLGHVDAGPVHCDAIQASDLRKPGTVIPCPLKLKSGCSGKDENMASLE